MATNNEFVAKDIYKKYDTPLLLQDKELLIDELANRNTSQRWFIIFGIISIFALLLIYLQARKRLKNYEKQASILLEKVKTEIRHQENVEIEEENQKDINLKEKTSLSEENYQEIKTKIIHFESSAGFTQNNLTMGKLAKDLETNRDYLSRFINEEKGKNFSQYLNDLRINHILIELKNNKKLRKYTISAIADEVGFSNSESFSNAFRKTTGTLPSYYIKLLEKESDS